jgi:hypothetical protein
MTDITSLADFRRHRAETEIKTAVTKFLVRGGTPEEARRIIETVISLPADTDEATRNAAIESAMTELRGQQA